MWKSWNLSLGASHRFSKVLLAFCQFSHNSVQEPPSGLLPLVTCYRPFAAPIISLWATLLCARLSKSVWLLNPTRVSLPLTEQMLFSVQASVPRSPGVLGESPTAVFSNFNIENWIEYYFFCEVFIKKKKKSMITIRLVQLESSSLLSRFQVWKPSPSKSWLDTKHHFMMISILYIYLYGAHRLLNSFSCIFSSDLHRPGVLRVIILISILHIKEIDFLEPSSLH